MHGWETRMLLRHSLQRGVSKAALARCFGVSRRTIHEWVETGQLDRDLSSGGARYSPRPAVPHKLAPYTGIIEARLEEFPAGLSSKSTSTTVHPAARSRSHRCVGHFAYNEFTGLLDGSHIEGTTLNGDSDAFPGANGCSAPNGSSGTFSIDKF